MLPPSAMPIIYKKSACWCDLISKYKTIDLSYYDEPMQCICISIIINNLA